MIKIGNAQAFWGDSLKAAANLVEQQPDLDYLTLDYLSEVSLSIMAAQKAKDPDAGYARDFIEVLSSLIPFWNQGSRVKIITNAGGLDPKLCAEACRDLLKKSDYLLNIAVVSGDNVLDRIMVDPCNSLFNHLESKEPISTVLSRLVTANAYLGAKPIAEALMKGADIVITGRVADPSLTVAPCIASYNWSFDDYNRLAQATVAGHLIECGTQVTGGISTNWLDIPDRRNIGFPVVEMSPDGSFVITKAENSGGCVNIQTVKEQLLYEIGDPDWYISPDAIVSFLSIVLENVGKNRIRVTGAKGSPPPDTYKVSAAFQDGFKAESLLVITGQDVRAKAKAAAEIIFHNMSKDGYNVERSCVECLGCGDVVPGVFSNESNKTYPLLECVLRVCVADHSREVIERFTKEIAPLVTCGPPGTTGYTTGRPQIRSIFGYWPCLIQVSDVKPAIDMIMVKS